MKKLIIQICNYITPYYIMLTSKYVPRKEDKSETWQSYRKKKVLSMRLYYVLLMMKFIKNPFNSSYTIPRSGKMSNITDDDIINTTGFVDENEIKMYVHTPYIIDLSNPINKKCMYQ